MNTKPELPRLEPLAVAADTWLIPNSVPAGPDAHMPMNSLLIRGAEPVIVDTGTPLHRDRWFEQVFSLVDPDDVRWVFVSHDDPDHIGNLHEVLERCPAATLVATFFLNARQEVDRPLPLDRMLWLDVGATFDVADRQLRLFLPPLFDGSTTRGLHDPSTGVMWAVDAFAAQTPAGVVYADDVPADLYDETFRLLNSIGAPWHQWLDRRRYRHHVEAVRSLAPSLVATAHGPVLTGSRIDDAFQRAARLAGEPVSQAPGNDLLHQLLAQAGVTAITTAPTAAP